MAESSVDGSSFHGPITATPPSGNSVVVSDYYNMKRKRTGVALIFNHYQFTNGLPVREGTEDDVSALQDTLPCFGFEVRIFNDRTKEEIMQEIKKVCAEDHSDASCIAVIVLSHGGRNHLYAYDENYHVEDLWSPITKCSSLAGKPKLFFFQACRGNDSDDGIYAHDADEKEPFFTIPSMADVVLAYSTVDGYRALRYPADSKLKGSPFIQDLCKALKEKGGSLHFEELMVHVRQKVAVDFVGFDKTKQVPQTNSTLTKLFKFIPVTDNVRSALYERVTKVQRSSNEIKENKPSPELLNKYSANPETLTKKIDSPLYKMNHPKRGEALIFSHKEFTIRRLTPRFGTEVDEKNLKTTLEKLKFNVTIHKDLTKAEIKETIKAAAEKDYTDCDCIMIVVMTHGTDNNRIYAKDDLYSVDDLWKPFTGRKAPSLVGKPKLFFVQACRGSARDPASLAYIDGDDLQVYTIPSMADVLVMYATVEGYVSYRNPEKGTVFIQVICNEFNKNAKKVHLENMLVNIKRKVAIDFADSLSLGEYIVIKQMPQLYSTLTRPLHLKLSTQQQEQI